MNHFVDQRRDGIKDLEPELLYVGFLDQYDQQKHWRTSEKEQFIRQLNAIKSISAKPLQRSCDFRHLGENAYLDKLIIDKTIEYMNQKDKPLLKAAIKEKLENETYNTDSLYSLLDIGIEMELRVLSRAQLLHLLEKNRDRLAILSILLEYALVFEMEVSKTLLKMIKWPYPIPLKVQMLEVILSGKNEESKRSASLDLELNQLSARYLTVNFKKMLPEKEGFILLQSMFHGDFEDSGKGNNGGLAVLLKSLGNEISKRKQSRLVLTITLQDGKKQKPLLERYAENHLLLRLPFFLEENRKERFVLRELAIKRAFGRFLKHSGITPDIFHVRYLDNASKAIVRLGKETGGKIVVTLTPDPHRGLLTTNGDLIKMSYREILENANKIKIGDELIEVSNAIVGIGKEKVKNELEHYFPQLHLEQNSQKLFMISEGIQFSRNTILSEEEEKLYKRAMSLLPPDFLKKPILLNVGRLNPIKGQDALMKAWAHSSLKEVYNLLIIGGNLTHLSEDEKIIVRSFEKTLKEHPSLRSSFCHLAALPNEVIRKIEQTMMERSFSYPPVYVCSSKKEEFGLAILEAMSKGFLVLAPEKGGVKTYMKNGENGFLIDTENWRIMEKEFETIYQYLRTHQGEGAKIQEAAQRTVEERYSLESISDDFIKMYHYVAGADRI